MCRQREGGAEGGGALGLLPGSFSSLREQWGLCVSVLRDVQERGVQSSEWSQFHNGGKCLRPGVDCSQCLRSISVSGPLCWWILLF